MVTGVFLNQERVNVCEHTTKIASVTIKIFQLSFRVFAWVFPPEISSIFGTSFPFPFPYFVLTKNCVKQEQDVNFSKTYLSDDFSQIKKACPPLSLHGQLLWREFFYCAATKNPNFDRMIGNPICVQIPWDKNAEALAKWANVSTKCFISIVLRSAINKLNGLWYSVQCSVTYLLYGITALTAL